MEPKSSSSHYLQPSATLPSTRRNSFQGVVGVEAGGGGSSNPFGPTFSDPHCNLNLKETSDFVRTSFPMATMARSNSSNGTTNNGGRIHSYNHETSTASSSSSSSASAQRRRAEQQVPATPGRPLMFFNSSSPAHHHQLLVSARRSVPSKWEDAEKWLRQASSETGHHGKGSKLQNGGGQEEKKVSVRRSVDAEVSALAFYTAPAAEVFLKDKFTDNVEPSKESFVFTTKNTAVAAAAAGGGGELDHRRDIGTEMTPLGSSTTSRCHTPIKSTSPARHNTPASRSGPLVPYNAGGGQDISDLADCHLAKLELGEKFDAMLINWSSKEEEEEEVSKSLRHFEATVAVDKRGGGAADCRWEDDDRAKSCIRYQREEAKIQAWINLESAKAEAQSRKLEVKIQKMRSNLEEKLMRRMTTVHRRAEEWRATAQAQHLQQLKRAAEQVRRAKATSHHHHHHHHLAGNNASCGCFPCNGNSNIISGNLLNYY
uniref:Remorin C-terminal domain-containing protein n=1 Tax=Leersia perrieri TaxID=77586 RepID=A0A0D9XU70_9ORYZ